MGLFREVDISTSGPVALRYPAVTSTVDSPANDKAHLTVAALLKNAANHPVKGTLKGRIEKIEFSQDVEVGAGESKDVTFTPEQFSQLNVDHPRLWWPAQMGKPELYNLSLEFSHRRQGFRPGGNQVWHSRSQVRGAGGEPAAVFHQWQEHSDPRRRLVSRHDAARELAAPARRVSLCAGHGPEYSPAGRQAGDRKNFSIWRTSAAFCSSPAGAAAIIGSIGQTGSRRISPSRNSRCAIRCTGCAGIPAWWRG